MALNFRLFNCDRLFDLDNVETLIQKVATKISREIKIEKTYFPLPRMNELCEELEKGDGSHFEYAVFVVHAHESRLWINKTDASQGYSRLYHTLQRITGDRVLIVIGGDDMYKGQEERDKSVLSRWAWLKICFQFTKEYVNGMKSFIFSWEETHHPIHEEALEFYLDPTKKGTKFEPRPRPPPVKTPGIDPSITQPGDVPVKRRFYKASISYGRVVEVLKHDPPGWKPNPRFFNDLLMKHQHVKKATIKLWDEGDGRVQGTVRPIEKKLCKIGEGFATDERHSIVVYSYHAEEETSKEISKCLHHLGVHELTPGEPIEPQSLITEISYTQPDYVMSCADADILEDEEVKPEIEKYRDIFKENIQRCVGKGVIIMLFGDMKYTQKGELVSKEADQSVRMLSQGVIPRGRLTVMSCRDLLYTTHLEGMKQALTRSRGAMQSASQGPGSSAPPSKQYYYRAEVQGDQVIKVLECIPPDWKPDEGIMKKILQKNSDGDRKAYLEIEGNERGEIVRIAVDKEWKGPNYFARMYAKNRFFPFF